MTLPLVSYGGSSLLASLLMFGIVQGIAMKSHNTKIAMTMSKNEDDIKDMSGKNSEYSLVFYIFTAIFIAMILYFLYFMIFESSIYIYSEYNKLMS